MSDLDRAAPALPSFSDESKANLFPFALMCAGWIAPIMKFWLLAFSPVLLLLLAGASVPLWWLPRSWYRPRDFERGGRVYELLGVRWFRRIVPNGDWVNAWRRRHDPSFRVLRNRADAEDYVRRTIAGERSHLVLLLFGFYSAAYAWAIGWRAWSAYLATANVLANVYPVMLQRYTRGRLACRSDRWRGRLAP